MTPLLCFLHNFIFLGLSAPQHNSAENKTPDSLSTPSQMSHRKTWELRTMVAKYMIQVSKYIHSYCYSCSY